MNFGLLSGLILSFVLLLVSSLVLGLDPAWGSNIHWRSSEHVPPSSAETLEVHRPYFILFHEHSCPACQRLKPLVAGSNEITALSQAFHMIQIPGKSLSESSHLEPDGAYIPRILFLAPNGTLLQNIVNPAGNPKYQYFYYDPSHILTSMKKVLEMFPMKDKAEL